MQETAEKEGRRHCALDGQHRLARTSNSNPDDLTLFLTHTYIVFVCAPITLPTLTN